MLSTKSAEEQKQLTSVLDLHPEENNQVFKHWGRTAGQSAVGRGPEEVVVVVGTTGAEVTTGADSSGVEAADVGTTAHLVQTVDVLVIRTVEVERAVSMVVKPEVTWEEVTGQRVVEVKTMRVVESTTTTVDGT